RTVGNGPGQDLPLAVLINGGSASAAEIVAVALRDNGRAELLGEKTFGTGTVLSPIPLDDGSMLVLGTGLWLTPKGEQMWHKGVESKSRCRRAPIPSTHLTIRTSRQMSSPPVETRRSSGRSRCSPICSIETHRALPPDGRENLVYTWRAWLVRSVYLLVPFQPATIGAARLVFRARSIGSGRRCRRDGARPLDVSRPWFKLCIETDRPQTSFPH
ncbi:MAG: hypothetical protein C4345_06870, partial [Chloroflexota bacterium]